MCTGIEIALLAAGAAATAGGTLLERNEKQKNAAEVARARNQELRDSMARQRRYEDRSRVEGVQKALDKFDPQEQAKLQAEDAARRDTAIAEAVTPTEGVEGIPLEGSTVPVVKDQIGKRLRDVFNTATERAKLAARPLTYADRLAGNNLALTDAGRMVDTQNSFARQEAAMLPSQQDFAAFMAQKEPSIWGPLLKTAGSALMGSAGSGYLAGSAAAKSAAATAAANAATPVATSFSSVAGAPWYLNYTTPIT